MVMEGVGRRGKAVAVVKTAVRGKKIDVVGKSEKKSGVSNGKSVDVGKMKAEMLKAKKEEMAKAKERAGLVKRKKEEDEVKTAARAAKKARRDDAIVVPVDDRGKATTDSKKDVKDSAYLITANYGNGVKKKREEGEETEAVVAAVVANGGLTEGGGGKGETRNPALPVPEKGSRPASARQLVRKRGRDVDALMKEGVPFSVTLSKKEILEDLTKMSGHVPVKWRKVKRRNVWGSFNMLNLGKFLHLVSLEQYDPEKFL